MPLEGREQCPLPWVGGTGSWRMASSEETSGAMGGAPAVIE